MRCRCRPGGAYGDSPRQRQPFAFGHSDRATTASDLWEAMRDTAGRGRAGRVGRVLGPAAGSPARWRGGAGPRARPRPRIRKIKACGEMNFQHECVSFRVPAKGRRQRLASAGVIVHEQSRSTRMAAHRARPRLGPGRHHADAACRRHHHPADHAALGHSVRTWETSHPMQPRQGGSSVKAPTSKAHRPAQDAALPRPDHTVQSATCSHRGRGCAHRGARTGVVGHR